MNTKHLSCVVLGFVMAAMAWMTLNMKGKKAAMQEEANRAQSAATAATGKRQAQEIQLSALKSDTTALRDYLKEWEPHLKEAESQELAELRLGERIKQGGLVVFSQRFRLTAIKDAAYVTRKLEAEVTFEDDYAKCLQWLGALEEELPGSRVASCILSKGQNLNDLRMELVIELPLTSTDTTKA
ncbi:hypothetical protein BH23VER1_BH23VER1_06300 [soil metagenome]